MRIIYTIQLVVLGLLILAGTSMAIEEPSYQVIEKTDQVEIRRYPAIIVAETKIDAEFEAASNQAFGRLFDYISGQNQPKDKIAMTAPVIQTQGDKIAMTAPVTQQSSEQGYLVQFVMPARYTMDNIPQPTDNQVTIRQLEPRLMAVHRFSGSWSFEHYRDKLSLLRQALTNTSYTPVGQPIFARFNPPFWPWFLRRNEIWIEVKK